MKIGVISDTHNFFDPAIPKLFAGVDHILHGGDIGLPWILLELEQIVPVTAVGGNTDDPGLCYKETAVVELERRKFLVHHIVNPRTPQDSIKERVAREQPDVVVFACTSAGALRGNAAEEALIASIARQTGAPTVSVAAAVRSAIDSRRARRIGVITPYVTSLNDKIRASLEEDGLEVAAIHGLGIVDNHEIGAVEPERIIGFACDCFEPSAVDLLFVSCTNFRAVEARPRIEELLYVPVVTSNQAALEAVLGRTASAA
jgi:maleate cis-trans isomerase